MLTFAAALCLLLFFSFLVVPKVCNVVTETNNSNGIVVSVSFTMK